MGGVGVYKGFLCAGADIEGREVQVGEDIKTTLIYYLIFYPLFLYFLFNYIF